MLSRAQSLKRISSVATFNGPSDPNVALQHASDFLSDKCTPCPYHQTRISILKSCLMSTGPSVQSVPELDYAWLCPTSTKKSTLPVKLDCKLCKGYFIHRGLVLEQIAKIGHHLDSMTGASVPVSWLLEVPEGFSKAEVVKKLSIVIHIALPDIVELYHTQHQVYWLLQSGLSGKPFSILLCLVTNNSTESIDISISMGTASLDHMAHQKKEIETMLLTGVDINHRETLRAASICTQSPYAKRSKQAMVFGQCKEMAAIFHQRTPFLERTSSSTSPILSLIRTASNPRDKSPNLERTSSSTSPILSLIRTASNPRDKSPSQSLIGAPPAKGRRRDDPTASTFIKTDSSKSCAFTEPREPGLETV